MKRSALALILSLTAVFISGTAVGALGYRFFTSQDTPAQTVNLPPPPETFRNRYLFEMTRMLDLTEEQVAGMREIMDETRQRFEELNARTEPEMQAIMQQQLEETNALLTEEQRVKFQEFLARRSEFRGRTRGDRGDRVDRRGGRDNRPPPTGVNPDGTPNDTPRGGRPPSSRTAPPSAENPIP